MIDYTSAFIKHEGNVYEVTRSYVGEGATQSEYENITKQIFDTLLIQKANN